MRKIYIFLLMCLFAVSAIAQDVEILKIEGTAPGLDGVVDDFWNDVTPIALATQMPADDAYTLDECTWRAVWTDTAIFVLVIALDDDWCPVWCTGLSDWQSDKPEVYFDVNVGALADTAGPAQNAATPNGHFQIAPGPSTSQTTDTSNAVGSGQYGLTFTYGYTIDGADEYWEYAAHMQDLIDKNGNVLDYASEPIIGFDACFMDTDEGDTDRKRVVWKNDGGADGATESWANMDACGTIKLSATVLGIADYEINTIEIYPNPATNLITINADFDAVEISNVLGQTVSTIQNIQGKNVELDLENGLYIISVYSNGNLIGTQRLLIK